VGAEPGRGVRVAVVQSDSRPGGVGQNLERAERFIADAARRGAALVLFPEMYLTGYAVFSRLAELALPPGAPALRALADQARLRGLSILIGYPERRPEGIYNALGIFTPAGRAEAPYRKIHLFAEERRHFRAGRRYRVVRLAGLDVGLLICYDLEFPESARSLALAGADVIAVSTANMEPFRADQDLFVRTRARENQLFLALANRVGREGALRFVGGSGIWSPSGEALAGRDGGEGIAVATVSRAAVRRSRRNPDYLGDRRPECYSMLTRRPHVPGRRTSPLAAGSRERRRRRPT